MKSRINIVMILLVSGLEAAPAAGQIDGDVAMQAYQIASNWVARSDVPAATVELKTSDVVAIHVTIRLQGWTAAQTTRTLLGDPTSPQAAESRDIMPFVQSAVRDALADARLALSQRGIEAAAANLVLDLQLAARPQTLRITAVGELPRHITPHADGLALSAGTRWSWSFPGNVVAANTDLDGRLSRLLVELDQPLGNKARIGTESGPSIHRFDVVHITRVSPESEPARYFRGQKLLGSEPFDEQRVALLGEQLADYVIKRQHTDGRFAGGYEPTSDQFFQPVADNLSAGYAVYALARASKLPGIDSEVRAAAARKGLDVLLAQINMPDDVSRQVIGQDLEVTAMTLLAALETPGQHSEPRDKLASALVRSLGADGWFRMSTAPDAPRAPRAFQALAAAAMVRMYDRLRQPTDLDAATRALDALWADNDSNDAYRTLPWIACAEIELARLKQPTANLPKLAALSEEMWRLQIRPWTEDAPPDTIGGFLASANLFNEPTWESGPVLAGLAIAMRQPQIVPEERQIPWLLNTGFAARFLAQLVIQSDETYYIRNTREAIDGVQTSMWDNRQYLRGSAAALHAVTELRLTLAELSARPR